MRHVAAVLFLALASAGAVHGQTTFVVNSTIDAVDAAPGDGICATALPTECTLRAAIMEASNLPGPDIVTFDPSTNGSPFTLTRPCDPLGCFFDAGSDGDLNVFDDLEIRGNGAAATVIQGGPSRADAVDRVLRASSSLTLSGLTIRYGNSRDGQGGAIATNAPLTITDCVIAENDALRASGFGDGGGIYSQDDLTLARVTIRGNRAGRAGGVYWVTSSALVSITDSTFEDNHALDVIGRGGALGFSLFGPNPPVVVLSNTTFSGNTAAVGCAVYHENAALRLHSVTVADNCVPGSGTASLVVSFGDGNGNDGGEFLLKNSILASAPGTEACRVETQFGVPPGFTSEGHNLGSDASCGLLQAGDVQGLNALLGPLADNGGPTRTYLPLPGSPAIDTGTPDCLATDQRGLGRPSDGGSGSAVCDKGSVEVAAAAPPPPPTTASIEGTAFDDLGMDTTRDPTDPGVPGVEVCLFPTAPAQCTTTGAVGDYTFSNLVPGSYHVYIRVPSGRLSSTPRARLVDTVAGTATTGVDFGTFVPPPPPPPPPSGPRWPAPSYGQKIRKGFNFFVRIEAPCAASSLTATVTYAGPTPVTRPMVYDPNTNTWEVEFETPGGPGWLPLVIVADCSPTSFSDLIQFIDPSGMILDACTGGPLEGATVTLQKNDPFGSETYIVPDPREHLPARNPELTTADGLYAWDVVPGRWRVQASKPGYETVVTEPFDVPPPKLNLDITLNRTNGCNVPPLASDDAFAALEDVPLTVAAPGVLGNDSDPDGGALTARLVSGPAHGVLALAPDGGFVYTPHSGFSGADGFAYRAEDAEGAVSGIAPVSLSVGPLNDPPFAAPDSYGVSSGASLAIASPGVLGNDLDPEGSALSAVLVTGPANGTLSLAADGSFTYTPGAGFEGTDSFDYQASDGALASGSARVTLTVEPSPQAGWTPTADLLAARTGHTATLLANGLVLAAGGHNRHGLVKNAELYDAAGRMWSPSGGLLGPRSGHTATRLGNGMVLVAGGLGRHGFLNSAELYDPATGRFAATAPLDSDRWGHTATLLRDGRVLVAGGGSRRAELYDPATRRWSAAGNLGVARSGHTATLLAAGRVLVVGGVSRLSALKSAELYDPATRSWSPAGSLAAARTLHSATELADGRVLVAGGFGASGPASRLAELYDPGTRKWTTTGKLGLARALHSATRLQDGRVIAAGGVGAYLQPLGEAEVYEPATGLWAPVEALDDRRGNHTATLLPDGTVLVAGGGAFGLASAEVFAPH